jgi:TRAP-type C4-dicarboxylate transport system substrate-binding protein
MSVLNALAVAVVRLAFAGILLGAGAGSEVLGQGRIKLGTLAPQGTTLHRSLQTMGEKWRQAPACGVTLTIYADGTMGSEADMVRRMRVGQLQAAMLTVAGLREIDQSVSALQLMPMMYQSLEEAEYVRSQLRPTLEKRLNDKGFVVLFWGDAGWVRFFSRQPALRPEEFKKMKMFVGAGDLEQVAIMRAAGLQPVPLEWSDALTSLQTGMIEAVPTTPFFALAGQYYRVTGHMLELNWVPLSGATVVTRRAWDELGPGCRDALLRAAAEAGERITERSRAESDEAVAAMRKRGLQVHSVPPEVLAQWWKATEEYYPRIRGSLVPAEMFDEVQRLVAGYRARPGGARP